MKRIFLLAVAAASLILPRIPHLFAQVPDRPLVDKSAFFRDRSVSDIQILEDRLYLATGAELYQSGASKDEWNPILAFSRGSNEIHCIAVPRATEIYVGTKRGLFKSEDGGGRWRNVFKTIIPEKCNILSIALSEGNAHQVLIGTERGVFLSGDSGRRWLDISNVVRNMAIRSVAIHETGFYAGGDRGVYFTKDGGAHWERLMVSRGAREEMAEEGDGQDDQGEAIPSIGVRCIAADGEHLYVGLKDSICRSNLGQRNWKALPAGGLSGSINFILPSRKARKLFVATSRGVYEYLEGESRWEALNAPTSNVNVQRISFGSPHEDILWAATDKGLFKLEPMAVVIEKRREVENRLREVFAVMGDEPTFRELQQAAIRYAEVGQEKIRAWRTEARLKALIPRVSIGVSRNKSTNSEIYTSATKEYVVVGPDDESKDLDVSVSWDLGNFIWSDDQTNIDVRSRLMVQLRNDILDDLRRVYYERRRIQFELFAMPPKDLKMRFEKETRLQELTQAIDDLTGNYFSERTSKGTR
jgi:hypothetical protein